jgi:hypothetical protein
MMALAVKIVLDNPLADVALGPGMSVEPTVRVDPKPSEIHGAHPRGLIVRRQTNKLGA